MDLQTQINELKQEIANLKRSSSFPLEVENAIRERLSLGSILVTGTGSAGSSTSYSSFPVSVPPTPSKTLKIIYNGTTYEVFVK